MNRIEKYLKSNKPLKWLFYGDSITHGSIYTFGHRDYTELFGERIRTHLEFNRTMDIVINTAIGGNTTRDLLSGFSWRVEQFNPDVVFLMIGMNDCSDTNDIELEEFENNILKLCMKIDKLNALPILQTTCPILSGQAPDRYPYFYSYMDAIRKVAFEQKLQLIDHTKYWDEHPESHIHWMSNEFHPNHYGHRSLAKNIYYFLNIYDISSHSCRLYIP